MAAWSIPYPRANVGVNKYHAISVTIDGIRFDSKSEAEMYQLLKADVATLHIDCHVPVTLPGGLRFSIDFLVWKKTVSVGETGEEVGHVEAIEVKGFATQDFKRMRKLFDETHPLSPLIVFKKSGGRWENI